MEKSNIFQILNIEPTLDFEIVRTKYLEVIKEMHSKADDSTEDKAKFMELKGSYDAIRKDSDLLKELYQKATSVSNRSDNTSNKVKHSSIFETMFNRQNTPKDAPRKGSPKKANLSISFFEALNGTQKKVPVSTTIKCFSCLGKGKVAQSVACDQCGGKGTYKEIVKNDFGETTTQRKCKKCSEQRALALAPQECKSCKGEGILKSEDLVELNIPKGVLDKQVIIKEGFGFDGVNNGPKGDLEVTILVEPLDGYYIQDGKLHVEVDVKYSILLTGGSVYINLGDREVSVEVPQNHNLKENLILKGEGIDRGALKGDVTIICNLYYPPEDKEVSLEALDVLIDNEL